MEATPLNLCNLPPWAIASRHFNRHPKPLEIQGVRRANRLLFERLDLLESTAERGALFHDYMDVTFQLHQWESQETARGRKSLKNSYLRFLRGWMFDSNALEGAVLKGWVESRLGLHPSFHREPIEDIHSEAYFLYTVDRMKGAARTSALDAQFDVLYEFTQYELQRRHPGETHFTLYRGINDFDEQRILETFGKNRHLVRLNNLASFTTDFERAWEFGSRVLETEVPLPKIFFRGDLLPSSLLKGEGEVMVFGGEYEVKVLIGG
ncbi:MAG: N-acyl homoserine lactonase [Desulfuromonas sp.]|uniref:NAD(+)--dinitrogen-reductase ADP-D-ribosyltransferase n=1 Tax=Desulfuromonas sp. TaxID=892 RepID=UPI000CAB3C1C|nr:NAD(+)--dinitrogen-reductase ADP-D-ribosyltransferase [Desulfuromonas sp.]PLX86658.1 MAG: N-acyl homoserine lactonase [Desulfuromonas sp.]